MGQGLAVAAVSSGAGELLFAKQPKDSAASPKLDRVCISSWSFHNYFSSTREKDFQLPGEMLKLVDFPEMVADRYHVHNMEFVAPHFESTSPSYLQELKVRVAKAHSRVVNIPVDIPELGMGGGLSDGNDAVRNKAIQGAMRWIDVGRELGCRSVRCDPGKMHPSNLAPTADSYRKIGTYGQMKGLKVIIENHDEVGSTHPEVLVNLFKMVGRHRAGALPDFGNFPDETTRERGLSLLFPWAFDVCHAKGYEFDAAGKETKFEFSRCVEISQKAKFRGVYSVEFEGPNTYDPYDGVQKVVNELVTYL
ncbi:MAG TPA: TIM barrel protein [Terriglobales bacterium]|nr:TIM barrel protein [Terriglobales bacterium]